MYDLLNICRQQAETYGSKTAFKYADIETGYDRLYVNAKKVAAALTDLGIKRGDRIGILAKNSAEYYEILIGASAIGVVLVPLNWRLAQVEVKWQLDDSEIRLLVLDVEFQEQAQIYLNECSALEHTIILYPGSDVIVGGNEGSYANWRETASAFDNEFAQKSNPESIVVQLYTSGTTGRPKAAMLSQRSLLAFRSLPPEKQPSWNRWNEEDVAMVVMPQFHVGGTGFGLQLMCAGATGLVVREFDAGTILDFVENDRLSKIFTVPSGLRLILDHPKSRKVNYGNVRTLIYGASSIGLDLLKEAMDLFQCDFVQQYGMTETSGTVCALVPEDHRKTNELLLKSVGRPLPSVEIVALDSNQRLMPTSEVGELAIRTPTIMSGYWNRPEANNSSFTADGFFLSGDAGYVDEDGYVFVTDRIKDMIVSGGENVYPVEVEAALEVYPDISEIVIVGVPDKIWGEAVKAFVVLKPNVVFDQAEFLSWARTKLAGYKLPKQIEIVDAIPRNSTGKVLRRVLRDLSQDVSTEAARAMKS